MEGHCQYRIDTESPIQRRPILLDQSDLILAGSFDPYSAVSPTKTPEAIGDAVWVIDSDWTQEACIRCGSRSLMRRGNFWGERTCFGMPDNICRELCKTAEPIEIPFGLWTRVSQRKHVMHIVAIWWKRLKCPCLGGPYEAAAMWPYVKLLWPLVYLLAIQQIAAHHSWPWTIDFLSHSSPLVLWTGILTQQWPNSWQWQAGDRQCDSAGYQ